MWNPEDYSINTVFHSISNSLHRGTNYAQKTKKEISSGGNLFHLNRCRRVLGQYSKWSYNYSNYVNNETCQH